MIRRWLSRLWEKEPLALVGSVVALVSLGLAIEARWSAPRDCEMAKPPPVAALHLLTLGKLAFELGDMNRAGLRRITVGDREPMEGLGSNALLQLVATPAAGDRGATVVLESYSGQNTQELRMRAERGVVRTCIADGDRSPCFDGPVALVIEGTQDTVLLSDGVTVGSVTDRSKERICWGKTMLHGLSLKDGELWIR